MESLLLQASIYLGAAVLGELAVDDIGQDPADGSVPGRRLDDGDGRLVAACFDAQHAHPCRLASRAQLS